MLAAIATLVGASDSINMGGDGFRLRMTPADPGGVSSSNVAIANCQLRLNHRSVLMHWSVTPFTHVNQPDQKSDAFLSATVVQKSNAINVSPSRTIDQTHLANNDNDAQVLMSGQGSGQAKIRVEVGLDSHGRPPANIAQRLF